MTHLTAPHMEAPGSVWREKKQGKAGVKVVTVDFHGNDWTRKAEQQGTLNDHSTLTLAGSGNRDGL